MTTPKLDKRARTPLSDEEREARKPVHPVDAMNTLHGSVHKQPDERAAFESAIGNYANCIQWLGRATLEETDRAARGVNDSRDAVLAIFDALLAERDDLARKLADATGTSETFTCFECGGPIEKSARAEAATLRADNERLRAALESVTDHQGPEFVSHRGSRHHVDDAAGCMVCMVRAALAPRATP